MNGLPNNQELAQKFMAAVFHAGMSGCECQACVELREIGKSISTPKPQQAKTKSTKH